MLINFDHIKTFYNALNQRIKGFRGNWTQNDPTADDYIKNRTHYTEEGEVTILKETQLTRENGEFGFESSVSLEIGKKYKIVYNGVTYECVTIDQASLPLTTMSVMPLDSTATVVFAGNYASMLGTGDTGEPFVLVNLQGQAIEIFDVNGATSCTIGIYEDTEIVHKLDKKFIDIPDGIVTEDSLPTLLEDNLAPVAFTNSYSSLSNKPTIYTDVVRYGTTQSLTTAQKTKARTNIDVYSKDEVTAGYMSLKTVSATLPTSAYWQSVAYGDGKFVAVASNSTKAAYSTDGIIWTQTTLPTSATWRPVTYGNGKFVAVAYQSAIAAYSTDGINWTRATLPTSAYWYSVTYGDGKFVASGNNIAAYSTDGINWTQTTVPTSANWYSVTYGNGKFVAVAYQSAIAAYSTDGITWTQTTLPTLPSSAYWYSVTYGDGKFVAVADGNNIAAYSTDGIIWTQTTLPTSATWRPVTYGNGKFVAVAYNTSIAAYSTDGINWTQTTLPTSANWRSVTYGDGKFVAVAADGNNIAAYSTDGINWSTEFTGPMQNGEAISPAQLGAASTSDIPTDDHINSLIDAKSPDWNASEDEAGYVKNRTHYEVVETINEPLNITWDGNIEGLVSAEGASLYKVSNFVLADAQMRTATFTLNNGTNASLSTIWDGLASNGLANEEVAVVTGFLALARKDNAILNGIVFPEAGIYFAFSNARYTASLTTTEPVEQNTTVVHKLDKKYLPDDVTNLATVATSGSYNDLNDKPTIYTDVVRYGATQSLTDDQKTTARTNIDAASTSDIPTDDHINSLIDARLGAIENGAY